LNWGGERTQETGVHPGKERTARLRSHEKLANSILGKESTKKVRT